MLTFPTINPSVVHQFIKTELGCKTLHYYLFLSIPQASQFLDEFNVYSQKPQQSLIQKSLFVNCVFVKF